MKVLEGTRWPDYKAATDNWDKIVPELGGHWREINYGGAKRPFLAYSFKGNWGGLSMTNNADFKVYLDGEDYFEGEETTHKTLIEAIQYIEAEIGDNNETI